MAMFSRIFRPSFLKVAAGNDLFYRHTSNRWIYNEKQQLDIRHVTFDVDALKHIAAKAVGANHCTGIRKTHEGSYNKIFCLTFDNSTEVIAKIPTKLVPSFYATASEVATMDYARTILHLPVPQVLAWSAKSDEIGSEYIVMERSAGVELQQKWDNMTGPTVRKAIEEVIEAENRFSKNTLSQIGGIYYKNDVPPYLRERPFYPDGLKRDEGSDIFRIGPLPDWDTWRGERELLDVDRGPWPDAASYFQGRIRIEQAWLARYAKSHPHHPEFSLFREKDVNKHLETLEQLYAIVPHIIPPNPEINVPVLWHKDLHDTNLMIQDVEGPQAIVGVIDWQFMMVAPLFTQVVGAEFLRYTGSVIEMEPAPFLPKLPENFNSLLTAEKAIAEAELVKASRQMIYATLLKRGKTMHYVSQVYPYTYHIVMALLSASKTWYEGLHQLREIMYQIVTVWPEIASGAPLPDCVDVASLERDHLEFSVRSEQYGANVAALSARLQIDADGWVSNERYEEVMKMNRKEKLKWDSEQMGGPYPFQDGAPSWFVDL